MLVCADTHLDTNLSHPSMSTIPAIPCKTAHAPLRPLLACKPCSILGQRCMMCVMCLSALGCRSDMLF